MSLADAMIIGTLDEVNKQSKHSSLMEFYKLDKEIEEVQNKMVDLDWKSKEYGQLDLNRYLMQLRALSLLKSLDII